MKFTVRNFHPDDFLTLWQIDQSCFPPDIAYSRRELSVYIRRPSSFTLVAGLVSGEEQEALSVGGQVLGFVVADKATRFGHIITIDVCAEARGKRVGSALLHAAEQRLRGSGCATVRLETAVDNLAALAFYEKHGYSVKNVFPRYYSNGVDALMLEKELLSAVPSE